MARGPRPLKVTVIIPARNDARHVAGTLESLFAQTRLPDEIIVADGCSTDDTVGRILAFADRGVPIRVVRNESVYVGGGRNIATRAARHDLIVELDLGNRADRNWLAAMVAPFEADPALDYLGGVYYPAIDTPFERVSAAIIYFIDTLGMTWTPEELRQKASVGLPGGLCMAYRRAIWERAGGFAEWARKGQDRLFSVRVRDIGGRIRMSYEAVMYHHMAASAGEAFDKHFLYGLWAARIGLSTRRFWRLACVYLAGLAVLGASLLVPARIWLALLLLFAYIYVGAWRKLDVLTKATGRPFTFEQRGWAIVVLFVKDAAVLSGTVLGIVDRVVRPRWRKLTREYLEDGKQPPTTSTRSGVALDER